MHQVGDVVTLRVMGTPSAASEPVYVWKWWDGAVAVTGTASGSVLKRLNLGGNPAESFTVPFRCDICDALGNVVQVLPDTIQVNNPPTVVPSPTASNLDKPFPYTSQIVVKAYDMEEAGVNFYWYSGTTPTGGHDATTSAPASVEGTYYGTLTGLMRTLYTNTFDIDVLSAGTVYTCKLVDGNAGTNLLHFEMRGYDPAAPLFAVAASPETLTASATSLPVQTIAPNQFITFTAYGYDPVPGALQFCWYFYGTHGWSQPGLPKIYPDSGTITGQGSKSSLTFGIEDETTEGEKRVLVAVSNAVTGKTTWTTIPVRCVLNVAPEITSVGVYHPTTAQEMSTVTKLTPPLRTLVRFSGTASDANNDVLNYRWDIYAPPASTAYTVYGRDGFVDVSDWSSGVKTAVGVVQASDRYGVSSAAFTIPQITIV